MINTALKLFIALGAILLLVPQVYKIEKFVDSMPTAMPNNQQIVPTSVDLFKISNNYRDFDKTLNEKRNTIADRNDLMTFNRCYQFQGANLHSLHLLAGNTYAMTYFKLHTGSFSEVQNRIIQEVIKFKDSLPSQKINGDVVVFISQVPYFVDAQNRTMTVQYHINQYIFKPYNITQPDTNDEPLDIQVLITFMNYNKKKQITTKRPMNLFNMLKPYESYDQKCKIECTHENKLLCGCANKGRRGGDPKNTAVCLGVRTNRPQEEVRSDFVINYKINKNFDPFVTAGVF